MILLLCFLLIIDAEESCSNTKTFGTTYQDIPLYVNHAGRYEITDPKIPLPPSQSEFPLPVRTYDDVDEPIFNPNVHLDLKIPDKIFLLPEFAEIDPMVEKVPEVNVSGGSKLAFTETFRILSKEGVKAVHEIIMREKHRAHLNFRNTELRGLYYLSPFIRDLVTSPELLRHLGQMIGEPIVPHFLSMDAPSVNFGKTTQAEVVDHWHFDSVAYVAVALVSDLTDMVGGDLQVIKQEKFEAIATLNSTKGEIDDQLLETVDYKEAGFSILVQGSEILHHVTPVKSAKEDRLSLIMAFQPANVYQPDKTVLDTWKKFDLIDGTAPYEFARLKAWKLSHALKDYVESEPFSKSGDDLAIRLNAVKDELLRVISLLQEETTDSIGWFDENSKTYRF